MLTDREEALLEILRADPLASTDEMSRRLGTSREAVRVHLSNLGKKGEILGRGYVLRDDPSVVVIGGANIDIKAQSNEVAIAATSNPGSTSSSPGGVGRNIAENLGRLGMRTHLIAAIGDDAHGQRLVNETRAAGVNVDHILHSASATGTYTAVLDRDGELLVAIADMAAADQLGPDAILASKDLISRSNYLVLDGNLRQDAMAAALDVATSASVPVLVDPVSDPKALTIASVLSPSLPVSMITPNASELAALTNMATGSDRQLTDAANALHRRGVINVWVRLGDRGSLLSSVSLDEASEATTARIPALPAAAVDVTGAGDAMAAAYVYALLAGESVNDAARIAHAAAALTIESEHTVRPDLTAAAVIRRFGRSIAQPATNATEALTTRKRQ